MEAEQQRAANQRRSLEQKRRFETEQDRLYAERRQRDLQRAEPDRNATLAQATRERIAATASRHGDAQYRFLTFYQFALPALRRDDYEAVKFAAEQMQILPEGVVFDRDYYAKLRALMPDEPSP